MILNIDILSPLIIFRVLHESNRALIIAIKLDRIVLGASEE